MKQTVIMNFEDSIKNSKAFIEVIDRLGCKLKSFKKGEWGYIDPNDNSFKVIDVMKLILSGKKQNLNTFNIIFDCQTTKNGEWFAQKYVE